MDGKLDEPIGSKRICYSCGNSYPDIVRFCPRDSADLEYLPQSLDDISLSFRRPKKRAVIWIVSMLLLITAVFLLDSLNLKPAGDSERGGLTVKTTPVGARVYLDGSQVGISPVRLSDIPTGVHEVRAVFPGYLDGQAKVEILPSATQKVFWDLSPLPARKMKDRTRFIAEIPSRDILSAKNETSEDSI